MRGREGGGEREVSERERKEVEEGLGGGCDRGGALGGGLADSVPGRTSSGHPACDPANNNAKL